MDGEQPPKREHRKGRKEKGQKLGGREEVGRRKTACGDSEWLTN